ncbi:MAG: hypothetical protein ACTSWF_00835 [Candidatus Freyarchaeota archaeon]
MRSDSILMGILRETEPLRITIIREVQTAYYTRIWDVNHPGFFFLSQLTQQDLGLLVCLFRTDF